MTIRNDVVNSNENSNFASVSNNNDNNDNINYSSSNNNYYSGGSASASNPNHLSSQPFANSLAIPTADNYYPQQNDILVTDAQLAMMASAKPLSVQEYDYSKFPNNNISDVPVAPSVPISEVVTATTATTSQESHQQPAAVAVGTTTMTMYTVQTADSYTADGSEQGDYQSSSIKRPNFEKMKKRRVIAQTAVGTAGAVVGFLFLGPFGGILCGVAGNKATKGLAKARENRLRRKYDEKVAAERSLASTEAIAVPLNTGEFS